MTEDSAWNQWLVQQIPKLFVKSLDYFKQFKLFNSQIEALIAYLRYVPLEEEIVGFFQHIPREIIDLLGKENCLPAVDINSQIMWKKPFECLMLKQSETFIRQVLTSELLEKYNGRYYLDSSLVNETNSRLLNKLGVHCLNITDLIEILESVFSSNNQLEIGSISQWLILLDYCFKTGCTVQQEEKFIKQLKDLPFIPIINSNKNKQLVSLNQTIVFFPLNKLKDVNFCGIDFNMESDLNLLDCEILLCLNETQNHQIIELLKQFGVKLIKPNEIVENHLIPILSNKTELKSEKTLISYLIYLHKYWQKIDLSKLKGLIQIKTNKGFKLVKNVYLSPLYGNEYDLEKLLPSYDWQLIDSIYLEASNTLKDAKDWRHFLIKLGINDLFSPNLNHSHYKLSELKHSPYGIYSDLLKIITNDDFYRFNDFNCSVFDYYTKNINDISQKELLKLFEIIEENWEQSQHLPQPLNTFKYVSVTITSSNSYLNDYSKEICESSYFKSLKTAKWILVESKQLDRTVMSLEEPMNVFVKEKNISLYYGLLVPYAATDRAVNSSFRKDLGFKCEFKMSDFINQFEKWIEKDFFHASILQMKNIYKLFSSNSNENHLVNTNKAFIFVPNEPSQTDQNIRIGKFYSCDEVYWKDESNLFDKYKSKDFKEAPILIEPIYGRKMEEQFVDIFKVKEMPKLKDNINLLEHMASLAAIGSTKFTFNEILKDVYFLYEILVDQCLYLTNLKHKRNDSNEVDDEIKANFIDSIKDKLIIPCYNNKWLSLSLTESHPILVDDTDLAEKFIDKLDMIVIPINGDEISDSFNDLCRFDSNLNQKRTYFLMDLLELKLFSKIVYLDLLNVTQHLRISPNVQNLCSILVYPIQCFFYYRTELKQTYQEFKEISIDAKLNKMNFFSVKISENIYRCKHDESITVIVSNKCFFDTPNNAPWRFFVRDDILEKKVDIVKGFVKIFTKNTFSKTINERNEKDLTNLCLYIEKFIDKEMTNKMSEEDIRDIEKEYKIKLTLPPNELKWVIKKSEQNKPDKSDSNENQSESGSLSEKFKSSQPNQRLLLEQLSRNQINIPKVDDGISDKSLSEASLISNINTERDNFSSAHTNSNNIENINHKEQLEEQPYYKINNVKTNNDNNEKVTTSNIKTKFLEEDAASLAHKMSISFNIEDKNQQENVLNGTNNSIEWSDSILDSFKASLNNSPEVFDHRRKIGRWGEIFVNEILKKELNLIKLEWMNEKEESNLPFDFRITTKSNEKEEISFIEVKTTTMMEQDFFSISYNEFLPFEIFSIY